MSVLKPAPASSNRFTYEAATRTFTTEASDLGRQPFGPVYDDACDLGLTIVSERTGREVAFCIEHEERDREGDLLYWILEPADLRERRELNVKVQVFND